MGLSLALVEKGAKKRGRVWGAGGGGNSEWREGKKR